ncbi:hypothetical protein D1AOALGA4SA_2798 [Olavius algarvensis Delta 1 endosymbiont]|nr:hypothetical protein D1AOALGA4SA_2798 [Olavius algarvensis Delta 1 endosymbiont]
MFDIRYSLLKSFFNDQTGCPLARGRALIKRHLKRTAEGRFTMTDNVVAGFIPA